MARAGGTLTRVRGVRVGHASDPSGVSGVTVVRFDRPAPTVVDVRGGAPATYDTASLALEATFGRRWAVFFAGGSVFGLDAATGIRRRILGDGEGHRAFSNPHRIVPISGAALFDLPRAVGTLPDYASLGYEAAGAASRGPVVAGRVGAGTGATVGKYHGRARSSGGGLGSAAIRLDGLGTVGALVVLNSVGAIRDPASGEWRSGARRAGGRVLPPPLHFRRKASGAAPRGTNLVCVVTDAAITRPELARVAILAHSGVARCVVPAHSATDGDVVFASTTRESRRMAAPGDAGARADAVGSAAADAVVRAILSAIRPR